MTTFRFTVSLRAFAGGLYAVTQAVCQDTTRDHLCRVRCELDPGGDTFRLVATDGHQMVVHETVVADRDVKGFVAWELPLESVLRFEREIRKLARPKKAEADDLVVLVDWSSMRIYAEAQMREGLRVVPDPGSFCEVANGESVPSNWRSVIPDIHAANGGDAGGFAAIDPMLLAKAGDVAQRCGATLTYMCLPADRLGAFAFVSRRTDASCEWRMVHVVMPMRGDDLREVRGIVGALPSKRTDERKPVTDPADVPAVAEDAPQPPAEPKADPEPATPTAAPKPAPSAPKRARAKSGDRIPKPPTPECPHCGRSFCNRGSARRHMESNVCGYMDTRAAS